MLVINSADDQRNPPESGLLEQALQHVRGARLYLTLASAETRGHGTMAIARFYAPALGEFLQSVPKRPQ